jgi:hypothetical protein
LLNAAPADAVFAGAGEDGADPSDSPRNAIGMQAENGLYQAFGVAADVPVGDVPAAAALPVKITSPKGADRQDARETTSEPTASAFSEAVVTASIVSLTVAASGLRTRSYPQMRRERR